jgi:hypothetical protein
MATSERGTDTAGDDASSPIPGPTATHSTPQPSSSFASGIVALAIDQLSLREPGRNGTVQERLRQLAEDIAAYLPQMIDNAAANTTVHGLLHMIGFGEIQHSSDKIESLTSMMDPIHIWDPHGCLSHRPVLQFIRQDIEIYGIPYAAPPSRTDVRLSPLLRKDFGRVAYSVYQDESVVQKQQQHFTVA